MASAIHPSTLQVRRSMSLPDPNTDGWVVLSEPDADAVESIPVKYRVLDAGAVREMTVAEKDAALPTWQAEHKAALKSAVNAYGESRYSWADEMRLKHAYNRAMHESRVNRAAYLTPVLAWEDALFADYATRLAQIDAAATHAAVYAVSLDFSGNDAADPAVSVAGAKSIPD